MQTFPFQIQFQRPPSSGADGSGGGGVPGGHLAADSTAGHRTVCWRRRCSDRHRQCSAEATEDVWLKWEGMAVVEAFEVPFCIIVDRLWSWIRALFGGSWSWFVPDCISDSDPMNQAQAAETVAAWEQPNGSVSVSVVLW